MRRRRRRMRSRPTRVGRRNSHARRASCYYRAFSIFPAQVALVRRVWSATHTHAQTDGQAHSRVETHRQTDALVCPSHTECVNCSVRVHARSTRRGSVRAGRVTEESTMTRGRAPSESFRHRRRRFVALVNLPSPFEVYRRQPADGRRGRLYLYINFRSIERKERPMGASRPLVGRPPERPAHLWRERLHYATGERSPSVRSSGRLFAN